MIDDYGDEPTPKPICLLELAALNPLPAGAEEAELQRLEEQEAWYAGLNLHREIFVLPLKAACDITPMGWQDLLFKTQIKLKSAIGENLQRQHLYDSAKVWASDEELEFKFADGLDAVFTGIAGSATRLSRWTCIDCGRRGRRRELGDDYVGTMCSKCVSPPLMKQQIDELRRSFARLLELGAPVGPDDVPRFLRPSFRQACELDETRDPNSVRMPAERFADWADEWIRIDAQVRRAHE